MQASNNLGALQHEELMQFQSIIDMENPDLFKWLTGQEDVPSEVRDRMQDHRLALLTLPHASGAHARPRRRLHQDDGLCARVASRARPQ